MKVFRHKQTSYVYDALIASLESRRMESGNGREINELLTKEYETALHKAGFDLSKIYSTGQGRYKVSWPIQIQKTRRLDVLRELYNYFYAGSNYTLEDVYQLAIKEYQKLVDNNHREQNTLDHYTGAWSKYISKYTLSKMKISEIKHRHIFNFFSDITANEAMTRSTLGNVRTTLSYCFDYAVQNDYLDSNPVPSVKTDKLVCKPIKRHDGYTRQAIAALRDVLKEENSPYARIIRLDTCLIVRIGELIAIKWKDVDFEGRRLHITAQIVRKKRNSKQSYEYVPYTKGNKYVDNENSKGCRWVNLNDRAVEVLKEQRKANPFGEYVFVSQAGTALIADKVNEHLKRYCEKAGIRYLSTHSIRVANITALYDSGVAPTKIQIAAGHSDIRTTNGYCRSEICDEIDEDTLNKAL